MARLAHLLSPRERAFYDLFDEAASTAVAAAAALEEAMGEWPASRARLGDVQRCVREAARVRHDVVHRLGATFVTPMDRHDILRLATALELPAHRVGEAGAAIDAYALREIDRAAQEQAWLLRYACDVVVMAVGRLRDLDDVAECVAAAERLEDDADRVVRGALARLFDGHREAVDVLRWKAIHQRLESAIDAARDGVGVVEALTIKYA